MLEKQTQDNKLGERSSYTPDFAVQVGSLVGRALSAEDARKRAEAEAVKTPQVTLDKYPDGSVIRTYQGPQKLKAVELAREIADDTDAVDVGPVLIRAVGQREDGSLERRVLFFNGRVMMGGAIDSEGKLHLTKQDVVDEAALAKLPDIEIRKPWESPFGNLGQVRSVSLPQVEAFAAEDLSYPGPAGPQPLAQARDLLEQFEQTQ